jgi:hypothetical protein
MTDSTIKHIEHQIPPIPHTSMYLWHKYWSRKTWNVVGKYIENYCPPNGIVFDPFVGSGITAMEALKIGKRVIACDLNPIATEITRLTIENINHVKIAEGFKRVEDSVKEKILKLYQTECRSCNKIIPFTCAIWKHNECMEIRYQSCPHCGDKQEKNCLLNDTVKDPNKPGGFYDSSPLALDAAKEWIDRTYPKARMRFVGGID